MLNKTNVVLATGIRQSRLGVMRFFFYAYLAPVKYSAVSGEAPSCSSNVELLQIKQGEFFRPQSSGRLRL